MTRKLVCHFCPGASPRHWTALLKRRADGAACALELTDAVAGGLNAVEQTQNGAQVEHVANEAENVHFNNNWGSVINNNG
jgi:hypothetical protein